MDKKFCSDITRAINLVLKKRGWSYENDTAPHCPLYYWEGNGVPGWVRGLHHNRQHPMFGLVIYRGFFYDRFSSNTKGVNQALLKHAWDREIQKYDQFIIEILHEAFIKVMTKHNMKRMEIGFASESYKTVGSKESRFKNYVIFNK